jgi:hypothetical protein
MDKALDYPASKRVHLLGGPYIFTDIEAERDYVDLVCGFLGDSAEVI